MASPQPQSEPAVRPAPSVQRIHVRPATTRKEREAFLRFAWDVYKNDPMWVPPLLMERRDFLNPDKNPFFAFATVALFIAEKDGQIVGRIAAVDDGNLHEMLPTRRGGWGMFECIDDSDVARALFETAEGWCRERGMAEMWGPVNLSTNQECGLLVEGFDDPPAILMTYNPPYYVRLVEENGYAKAKDLWAFELDPRTEVPEKVTRVAEKIRKKHDVVVRPVVMKELAEEIRLMEKVYNEAWEENWGFVPMTSDEFSHMAKDLKQIVVPELVLMAEVRGEPAAFCLTLPDFNEVLHKINGRLTPWALARVLYYSRKVRRVRLVAMGVRAAYRKQGIDSILYLDTIRTAKRLGYTRGEVSWTLEDNELVNRAIEVMGGQRYKNYRLYSKNLA